MMKRSFFLLFALCLFGTSAKALSLNMPDISHSMTHTYTTHTLELKPASLENAYQTAAICFLGGNCQDNAGYGKMGDESYTVDPSKQCQNEGYSKISCNEAQEPAAECPYDTSYGSGCKCKPNLITCASDQVGVGSACGGKYVSCACKPEYQYTVSNCTSPRSPSGSACGGKYNTCSCPKGVSAGVYGCKEYYASPCGSVCKTAHTDNCHNRTSVTTPYGCMSYFADCSSKCEKAYTDNCRSRTDIPAVYGCKTFWSDCSTKCQDPYTDNCHNRTAVTANFGCQAYYADCTSKCQTANSDNCHNRTAVTTPYGCKTYFSDCKSKCQVAHTDNCHNRTAVAEGTYGCKTYYADCTSKCETAYTNNCHNRTAVSTPYGCAKYFDDCPSKCQIPYTACNATDFLYSNKKCTVEHLPELTPIGIVMSKADRLAYALEIKALAWSTSYVDVSGLSNIGTSLTLINENNMYTAAQLNKDTDGKSNTLKIINFGKSKGYSFPAAEYAYNYSTAGTNKGDWWLQSAAEARKADGNLVAINNKLFTSGYKTMGDSMWTSNPAHKQHAVDTYYFFVGNPAYYGMSIQQFHDKSRNYHSRPITRF